MAKKNEESFNDLISISEAARLRGVSHAAIQNLIRRGKLSSVEIGGRRFLRRTEVDAYKPEPIGRPPKPEKASGTDGRVIIKTDKSSGKSPKQPSKKGRKK